MKSYSCDHLDVNYPKEGNTETLELNLLLKLEKSLNELTTEELQAFSRDMQLNLTNPTPQLILIAVQAAIRTSGIAALEVATLSAIGVINALGGIATIGTLFAAHRALSLIAGPIGLAVSSAWLVADLAGPAYRVTVPLPHCGVLTTKSLIAIGLSIPFYPLAGAILIRTTSVDFCVSP